MSNVVSDNAPPVAASDGSGDGPVFAPSQRRLRDSAYRFNSKVRLNPLRSEITLSEGVNESSAQALSSQDRITEESALSFVVLQSWVGSVEKIAEAGEEFSAVLRSSGNPDETAEFSFDEVSPDDRSLIFPGAVFYWNVGYLIEKSGRKMTSSVIRFRRLKFWTRKKLDAARARANQYRELLNKGNAAHRPA